MTRTQSVSYSDFIPVVHNPERSKRIVGQIIAVLKTHLRGEGTGEDWDKRLSTFRTLDVGCSSGMITAKLADSVEQITGIDVDKRAIDLAQENYKRTNLSFVEMDAMKMDFGKEGFDLVIAHQAYCSMASPEGLMEEIYRVLKPGGMCFLAAANKYKLWESQYQLPFLSFLPRKLADGYIKLTGKHTVAARSYLSFWQLRKLCEKFVIHRYTAKIIHNPAKYNFVKLKPFGKILGSVPISVLTKLEPIVPTFVWVLEKPGRGA